MPPRDGGGAASDSSDGVAVTFHPQEWVDSPSDAHDWDRRQLVGASDRGPVTFVVPRADATDAAGEVFDGESYEANMLQLHDAAPSWVQDWDGPYYVTLDED